MKNIFAMNNVPPPPPQGSRKMLYAIIAIVIIVVAVAAGAFLLMQNNPNNPNPSTSPTPTPYSTAGATSTPTVKPSSSSSATATPAGTATPTPSSSAQPIANFKAGTWANYTMKSYTSGTLASEARIKEGIDEEVYKSVPCWVMTMATDQIAEGQVVTSITKIWMSKSSLNGVHMSMEVNGVVIIDEDLNGTDTTTTPGTTGAIDPNTVIGYETITVAAGTFTNCAKASSTITTTGGTTSSIVWANQAVPIFGLVKMETRLDGQLSSTMELTAYQG